MGGKIDKRTNGGSGDEGRVGRRTCVRMGVRDGWEDGQAYEWGEWR